MASSVNHEDLQLQLSTSSVSGSMYRFFCLMVIDDTSSFKRLAYVTEHLCARRFEKPLCGAFPVSRSVGFFEQWKISLPPIDNMERESTDVVGVAVTSIGLSDVVIPCSLFIHPSSGHEKSSLRYPTSSSSCSPVSSVAPTITWSSASCVWADFLLAVTGVNSAFGTLASFCMLSTGTE